MLILRLLPKIIWPSHSDIVNSFTTHKCWLRIISIFFPVVIVVTVILQPWYDPRLMFMDPMAAGILSGDCCYFYYGMVSQVGVILWASSAAICGFAALILFSKSAATAKTGFAAFAAVLSAVLALDDALLIHEEVAPLFHIPQNAVLASYAILAIVYVAVNLRQILQADALILAMAAGFMAISLLIDVIVHSPAMTPILLEDGAKFIGIFAWTVFHISAMFELLETSKDVERDFVNPLRIDQVLSAIKARRSLQ